MRALKRHNRRVRIMGIVNRTPDSFFDGGSFLEDKSARARVDDLVREGADIVDVGAESTRPGAPAVSADEQIARLADIVSYAAERIPVSIDTTCPEVAARALDDGASMVNSVSLEPAAELGRVAARANADLVLTHCRGAMSSMKGFSEYSADAYDDIVEDVAREWRRAADLAVSAGLADDKLVFDPGLGFTKSAAQSLELCVRLAELKQRLGVRVLVGASRKSYIANTVASQLGTEPAKPADRLGGTIAAVIDNARRGADIVRVHDVAPVAQALAYDDAMTQGEERRCSRA